MVKLFTITWSRPPMGLNYNTRETSVYTADTYHLAKEYAATVATERGWVVVSVERSGLQGEPVGEERRYGQ